MAGDCGEWAYSWKNVFSGYAPAHVVAWREWLRERYGNDPRALADAWRRPGLGFDDVQPPPRDRLRRDAGAWPPASGLIDPAADRPSIDWLHFLGTAQARAAAGFAAVTRQTLNALGRRKLVAVFNGYHFWGYDTAYGPCNSGFSDLDPVLESPDIDIVCTPLSYVHRQPGGLYAHHALAASVRLRGKMFYAEDDTFTQRAKWTPWRYCCKTAGETMDILRRNLAGTLSENAGLWWMDHDCGGWYLDPELEKGVAEMRRWAAASLDYDRAPEAEAVFLVNEASFRLLRQDPDLFNAMWPRQQAEFLRIGAAVDFLRVRDLEKAVAAGDAARWKFVLVAGCLWLDDGERELLRRALLGGGRTVLFLHGQGLSDGARLDLARAGDLCGIALKTWEYGGFCRAETVRDGRRVAWGSDRKPAPLFYADDPDAEVLGWFEGQYVPALARKRRGDWTALWCGAPGIPWDLLGALAADAGVHRYLEDGSQVMANAGFVAVHAVGGGPRTLRLPRSARLVDVFGGTSPGVVQRLELDLRRGETRAWHRRDA